MASGRASHFPRRLQETLQDAIELGKARERIPKALYVEGVAEVRQAVGALTAGNYTDAENLKLAKHVHKHQDALLAHLDDATIPPTNNTAEHEIRGAVVLRKMEVVTDRRSMPSLIPSSPRTRRRLTDAGNDSTTSSPSGWRLTPPATRSAGSAHARSSSADPRRRRGAPCVRRYPRTADLSRCVGARGRHPLAHANHHMAGNEGRGC